MWFMRQDTRGVLAARTDQARQLLLRDAALRLPWHCQCAAARDELLARPGVVGYGELPALHRFCYSVAGQGHGLIFATDGISRHFSDGLATAASRSLWLMTSCAPLPEER